MELIDPKEKKLIYITACGRSGTTILGYLLGNTKDALDLGEVNEWLRFDGKPNGFPPGTENYAFWEKVMSRFIEYHGKPDFDRLRFLQRHTDYHYSLFGQVVTSYRLRQRECQEFRRFLRALYQAIFDVSEANFLVDSSKYPSRLWHLTNLLPPENLLIVHLQRSAKAVIEAMKNAEQGRPRSSPAAAAYYYGIEFLITKMTKTIPASRLMHIQYESLMRGPEEYLRQIGQKFQMEVESAVEKVSRQQPLRRGYIFNGNRMRLQEHVIFRKKPA